MKSVIVITGATACGKSSLALELAKQFDLEIIGADSRQIYKGLIIGTASPTEADKKLIPHHLFNFLEPTKQFSAGLFIRACREIIEQVHSRGKTPLLVGGAFFYIKALWDGLLQEPETPDELKSEVFNLQLPEVLRQLKKFDQISFDKIQHQNDHRLRRALLISRAGNKPFSSYQPEGGLFNHYRFQNFYLARDREEIYQRINKRVRRMFREGLLDEVRWLQDNYANTCPAMNTIGYKQFISKPVDEVTSLGLNEIETEIARLTRNFAKRQLTWFRNETRLKRIDYNMGISQISENISVGSD